jgi:hypothetical protein
MPRWLLRVLALSENVMFMAIAVALLVIGVIVFVRGARELVAAPPQEPFAVTVTRAVNSVLFIVSVLELVRTIVARLEGGGFQLQPFLVGVADHVPGEVPGDPGRHRRLRDGAQPIAQGPQPTSGGRR